LQINLQTAAQHADLMHKIEKLNLLQDTNQQLREENSRISVELKELATKVCEIITFCVTSKTSVVSSLNSIS
jgi:hypothetical protein